MSTPCHAVPLRAQLNTTSSPPVPENAGDGAREALLALSDVFPVFPSPRGCDRGGTKVDFVQTLDFIARRMETARPQTKPWHPKLEDPPHGWVLKREFSDRGRHVYIPNHSSDDGEKAIRRENKRVQKFILGAETNKDPENVQWLAQEYIPTLTSIGEFRFMCINGNPTRVVITTKRAQGTKTGELWITEGIRTMLGLDRIR